MKKIYIRKKFFHHQEVRRFRWERRKDLKFRISQEPREIGSDATYHESIHVHLCWMTLNLTRPHSLEFSHFFVPHEAQGKLLLQLWKITSGWISIRLWYWLDHWWSYIFFFRILHRISKKWKFEKFWNFISIKKTQTKEDSKN